MFLAVERDTVSVIRHCIKEIVQILRIEDVSDICEEGVGQPTNATPFADKGINIIGRRVTLRVDVGLDRCSRIRRVGQTASVSANQIDRGIKRQLDVQHSRENVTLIPCQRMALGYIRLLPVVGEIAQISAGAFSLRDGIGVTEQSRDRTSTCAPLANREFKPLNPTIDAVEHSLEFTIEEVAIIVGNVNVHTIDEFVNILGEPGDVNR